MEYLIGQAMIKSDRLGELTGGYNSAMYKWGPDHPRMDRYPLARLVIDEKAGALAPGTGLYVASPARAGRRYYAVVSYRGGVPNTVDFGAGSSLGKPVAETVGPGQPVRQGQGLWGPFFDYPGRRQVYVQWCAPPLAPRANMYFNWSVLAPPDTKPGQKLPAEIYFHKPNFSYAKPRIKLIRRSIQLAPHDWPPSGWYGFNDAAGTLKSYRTGTVSNHTQKRIMAFLTWAEEKLPIDPQRIVLLGSDGAAMLALSYPDRFAYVLIDRFENEVLANDASARFSPVWGPRSPEIKDDRGRGEWSWAMLDELVKASPDVDLPLFVCRGYSWAPFVKRFARGYGRFYEAMLAARKPLVADWTWASGKLVRPDKYTGRWRGLDLTSTTPVPAFSNCSADNNKEGDGQHNLLVTWDGVKDEPDGFTIELTSARDATFDMMPRRLQNFKVSPGQKLRWEARAEPTRTDKQPKG
ncbi:hypothetical protein LCGC14_2300570, partial [marine sediment metagenome]